MRRVENKVCKFGSLKAAAGLRRESSIFNLQSVMRRDQSPRTANRKLKTATGNGQWIRVIDAGAERFVLRSRHVLIAVGVVDRDKLVTQSPVNTGS